MPLNFIEVEDGFHHKRFFQFVPLNFIEVVDCLPMKRNMIKNKITHEFVLEHKWGFALPGRRIFTTGRHYDSTSTMEGLVLYTGAHYVRIITVHNVSGAYARK